MNEANDKIQAMMNELRKRLGEQPNENKQDSSSARPFILKKPITPSLTPEEREKSLKQLNYYLIELNSSENSFIKKMIEIEKIIESKMQEDQEKLSDDPTKLTKEEIQLLQTTRQHYDTLAYDNNIFMRTFNIFEKRDSVDEEKIFRVFSFLKETIEIEKIIESKMQEDEKKLSWDNIELKREDFQLLERILAHYDTLASDNKTFKESDAVDEKELFRVFSSFIKEMIDIKKIIEIKIEEVEKKLEEVQKKLKENEKKLSDGPAKLPPKEVQLLQKELQQLQTTLQRYDKLAQDNNIFKDTFKIFEKGDEVDEKKIFRVFSSFKSSINSGRHRTGLIIRLKSFAGITINYRKLLYIFSEKLFSEDKNLASEMSNYLIAPLQRLTKYVLFFKTYSDILKKMDNIKAYEAAEEISIRWQLITIRTNELKKIYEGLEKPEKSFAEEMWDSVTKFFDSFDEENDYYDGGVEEKKEQKYSGKGVGEGNDDLFTSMYSSLLLRPVSQIIAMFIPQEPRLREEITNTTPNNNNQEPQKLINPKPVERRGNPALIAEFRKKIESSAKAEKKPEVAVNVEEKPKPIVPAQQKNRSSVRIETKTIPAADTNTSVTPATATTTSVSTSTPRTGRPLPTPQPRSLPPLPQQKNLLRQSAPFTKTETLLRDAVSSTSTSMITTTLTATSTASTTAVTTTTTPNTPRSVFSRKSLPLSEETLLPKQAAGLPEKVTSTSTVTTTATATNTVPTPALTTTPNTPRRVFPTAPLPSTPEAQLQIVLPKPEATVSEDFAARRARVSQIILNKPPYVGANKPTSVTEKKPPNTENTETSIFSTFASFFNSSEEPPKEQAPRVSVMPTVTNVYVQLFCTLLYSRMVGEKNLGSGKKTLPVITLDSASKVLKISVNAGMLLEKEGINIAQDKVFNSYAKGLDKHVNMHLEFESPQKLRKFIEEYEVGGLKDDQQIKELYQELGRQQNITFEDSFFEQQQSSSSFLGNLFS